MNFSDSFRLGYAGSVSPAEVTNVSPHGFWLFIGERELFVPFNQFPWFRNPQPDLDIDLAASSVNRALRLLLELAKKQLSKRSA